MKALTISWAMTLAAGLAVAWGGDDMTGTLDPAGSDAIQFASDAPLPIGFGITYFYQEQDYRIGDLTVDLPEIDLPEIPALPALPPPAVFAMLPPAQQAALLQARARVEAAAAALAAAPPIPTTLGPDSIRNVRNQVHNVTFKPDWWVLPFLNIHGIYGYVDGEVNVDLAGELNDVNVGYDGWVYGGGLTLAAAVNRLFGAVTVDYTEAEIEPGDSSIGTWVVLPKVGIRGERATLYVGGHYQSTQHNQAGTFDIAPFGPVAFDVTLEDEHHWNYVAGGEFQLSERLFLTMEGGFGDRYHGLVSATVRF